MAQLIKRLSLIDRIICDLYRDVFTETSRLRFTIGLKVIYRWEEIA